jgi:signal transduction histidine kinase/ActR/RegA family two-component response regulator
MNLLAAATPTGWQVAFYVAALCVLACVAALGLGWRDRKALRRALQESRRQVEAQSAQAEQAAQFRIRFLADFSHELRTPLNGVVGATELLQTKELPPQARHLVSIQRQSADHLLTLVTEVLDYAKLAAGKMPLMNEAFDIRAAAAEVTEMYAALAQSKAVELISIVDSGVPSLLSGDAMRVRQILSNLVVNALRHTSVGAVEIHARWRAAPCSQPALVLEVRDTGAGMSPQTLQNLFQPYGSAVDDPLQRARTTGLGLTICRNLAELMGGEISVQSALGQGSTFTVSLALSALPDVAQAASSQASAVELIAFSASEPLQRQLIALAQDTRMACTVHEDLQELARYDATAAQLGKPERYLFAVDVRMLQSQPDSSSWPRRFARASMHHVILMCDGVVNFDASTWSKSVEIYRPLHIANWRQILEQACVHPASRPDRPLTTAAQDVRALIVDDNPINQLVASSMLGRLGIQTVSATSGIRALHLIQEAAVDVVFMDLIMPGMDGMETTRALRRIEAERKLRRVPVIALTSLVDPQIQQLCREAGMEDFIAKPLTLSSLSKVLQTQGFSMHGLQHP